VQTDEKRVEDVYERVIDLPIADVLYAAFLHIMDGAAFVEGLEAAAMPVRGGGDFGLLGEQNVPVEAEIG